jgi:O-acetyl-ADP-ribose deacetylase (regulator of RNase III)
VTAGNSFGLMTAGIDAAVVRFFGEPIMQRVQHRIIEPIETAAFPAMGTGFGGVPFGEAARQMAAAYRHYLEPPHRLDWDFVVERQRAIHYDGGKQVSR